MIELACPESCHYLHSAREQVARREAKVLARLLDRSHGRDEHILEIANIINSAILDAQRGREASPIRGLQDTEILAALENAIRNLETEDSGLIYEHRAPSSRVREVSQRIRLALESVGDAEINARLTRGQMLKALRFVAEAVEAHLQDRGGDRAPRSYLRYIALFYPWPDEATKRILVTGDA